MQHGWRGRLDPFLELRSATLSEPQTCDPLRHQSPASVAPTLLAETSKTFQASNTLVETLSRRHVSPPSKDFTQGVPDASKVTCTCRTRKQRSTVHRSWISIFSEDVYQHSPNCSLFTHADHSQSIVARFTIYNRSMGLCVQVGWQQSRRGGWNSVAPLLQYRAVVPSNSGAFKILEVARSQVLFSLTVDQMSDLLMKTSSELRKAFCTGASPYYEDENGKSILFVRTVISPSRNVLSRNRTH